MKNARLATVIARDRGFNYHVFTRRVSYVKRWGDVMKRMAQLSDRNESRTSRGWIFSSILYPATFPLNWATPSAKKEVKHYRLTTMRYFTTFALSLVSLAAVEGAYLRHGSDGGLEFEVDLSEIPRHLSEIAHDHTWEPPSVIGREYEYEEGSNAGLLNELIAFFLPHINNVFQELIPDPLPIPIRGSFNLPEINLFGYCKASAGFNASLGTMVGLSGLGIDRMQVLTGTERISAGWNLNAGCLETIFTAFVDMEVSSTKTFAINDLSGGVHGNVCSYSLDEHLTGGILTFAPKMRGAVNISGALTGTKATIKVADIRNSLKMGYERIEGYIDDAPRSLNEAVRNITSELSILAKEQVLNFIMQDELLKTVEPEVKARAKEGIQGREVELRVDEALKLNGAFMRNQMGSTVDNAIDSSLSLLQRWGFSWT